MALNQTGITKVSAVSPKTIITTPEMAIAFPCIFANTGIDADANGKKIIKAGTPVTGSLEARGTAFTIASTSEATEESPAVSNAIGLALHDVDVTEGNANGTVLVQGVVQLNDVDTTTAALITSEVKTAVHRIIFIK